MDTKGPQRASRVLLVERDPQLGALLERALRRDGHAPIRVDSGVDALLAMRDHTVHLVIAELELRDMTGVDLMRAVRRSGRDCRVALLSQEDSDVLQREATDAAVDALLQAPISPGRVCALATLHHPKARKVGEA